MQAYMNMGTKPGQADFTIYREILPRANHFHYVGAITEPGMKALCDMVERGFELYSPSQTTVHVRSAGGLQTALEFVNARFGAWRKEGRQLSIVADTECASAAAMMVTLGPVGTRGAHPLCKLLFHYARAVMDGPAMLEQDAEAVATALKESRERMHGLLQKHLAGSLGVLGFARTLSARAAWLLCEDKSSQTAQLDRYTCDPKPLARFLLCFQEWAGIRITNAEQAGHLITQWNEQIELLFRRDQVVDLRAAWALLLIDQSDGLPAIVRPDAPEPQDTHTLIDDADKVRRASPVGRAAR